MNIICSAGKKEKAKKSGKKQKKAVENLISRKLELPKREAKKRVKNKTKKAVKNWSVANYSSPSPKNKNIRRKKNENLISGILELPLPSLPAKSPPHLQLQLRHKIVLKAKKEHFAT